MTLDQAKQNFHQNPSFDSACAYVDAAMTQWERLWFSNEALALPAERLMRDAMKEVRAWLMNQKEPANVGS